MSIISTKLKSGRWQLVLLATFVALSLSLAVAWQGLWNHQETIPFKAASLENADFGRAWPVDAGVVDHHGQARSLSDFRGKVVLLFFGYTQCPDVCPTALHRATQLMAALGQDAEKVQVLFMTLDPQRDTLEVLSHYVPAFDPRFIGLRPQPGAVADLARTFQVFYHINTGSSPDTYTLDHSATTYAYDLHGKLRLAIRHAAAADEVTADIRRLLNE